jgi:hypothetical protein
VGGLGVITRMRTGADLPLFRLTDNSSRTKRRPTRLLLDFEGLQRCGRPGPLDQGQVSTPVPDKP